jgi:ketosteroid isomerase-like protein
MDTSTAEIRELDRAWAAAELAADTAALDARAVPDFQLVGPLGFVLDKQQWLHRYRSGDLRTTTLEWAIESVRVYGDAAVTIGTHTQTGDYRGRPTDGAFRSTHVAVRRNGRWQLASIHLSPIQGPPAPGPKAAGR